MDDSPFRDDREALRSVIEALQRENEALAARIRVLDAEIQQLRDASPENQQAFARRLQQDNEELRARVADLEPLRELVKGYERRLSRQDSLDVLGPLGALIRRIWGGPPER